MPAKMRIAKITTSTGTSMAAKWVPSGAEMDVSRLEFIKMLLHVKLWL